MQKPVPASYGQASYHAEHAFLFTAADGMSRFGRYRWMPEAGEAYLSPDEASRRSANFLREELESRLLNGPVVFRLLLQLAKGSDPTDDVTALWPADRPFVELGRLEVTSISPTGAADERRSPPANVAFSTAPAACPRLTSLRLTAGNNPVDPCASPIGHESCAEKWMLWTRAGFWGQGLKSGLEALQKKWDRRLP